MAADTTVEQCSLCVAEQLLADDNGYCRICSIWLEPPGLPNAEWEPTGMPPGRVCAACRHDLERRLTTVSRRLLRLLGLLKHDLDFEFKSASFGPVAFANFSRVAYPSRRSSSAPQQEF